MTMRWWHLNSIPKETEVMKTNMPYLLKLKIFLKNRRWRNKLQRKNKPYKNS